MKRAKYKYCACPNNDFILIITDPARDDIDSIEGIALLNKFGRHEIWTSCYFLSCSGTNNFYPAYFDKTADYDRRLEYHKEMLISLLCY